MPDENIVNIAKLLLALCTSHFLTETHVRGKNSKKACKINIGKRRMSLLGTKLQIIMLMKHFYQPMGAPLFLTWGVQIALPVKTSLSTPPKFSQCLIFTRPPLFQSTNLRRNRLPFQGLTRKHLWPREDETLTELWWCRQRGFYGESNLHTPC